MIDFSSLPIFFLILIIIFSLFVLIKSADFFVEGASSISRKFGISAFVVGLTIIAIGTSAPELFVNVSAAISGATDLSIGNIIGSNIAGLLLGLGIAAIIVPLKLKSQTVWKEIPFTLLGAVLIFLLGGDLLIQGYGRDEIGFVDGVVLLLFFVIFMVYSFALNKTEKKEENDYGIKIISYSRSALYIVGGITGLVLAGNFIVDSAVELGLKAGLSQNLLGLTVVAAGTSLPEIITAIAAARKKQIDMVIGGIVGTVVFNAFFALGVTATVSNLPFSSDSIFDVLFLVVISIMFFFFMFVGKRNILEKWQGYLFVLLYVIYISYVVFRG